MCQGPKNLTKHVVPVDIPSAMGYFYDAGGGGGWTKQAPTKVPHTFEKTARAKRVGS